jgi:hypothetical protein
VTVGGDKGFDTAEFVRECRNMRVTPLLTKLDCYGYSSCEPLIAYVC